MESKVAPIINKYWVVPVRVASFVQGLEHRKKLNLEYDDIAQWNSGLIYADLTGYGEKGPDADLPRFDGLLVAKWLALSDA